MSDQHEGALLVGRGERCMEIARHAGAVVRTILVVAPDDPSATIGASPGELCHLILHLGPAERTVDTESRFEHDRRAARAAAINLDTPAADIDETPRCRKIADFALTFNLLPDRADTEQKRNGNRNQQADELENSGHGNHGPEME